MIYKKKNKNHPQLELQKEKYEKIQNFYCPGCELEYFMTQKEYEKHIAFHKKIEFEEGEDDTLI
jgi:hypothetical protein